MPLWLGVDCGGTFIKAGVYDERAKERASARQNLEVNSPQPGYAERDLEALWEAMCRVIREVLSNPAIQGQKIEGVGISAQGKGVCLLDAAGAALGPAILSSDQRALQIVKDWQAQGLPRALYPKTCQTLWTGHPVSILRWVKVHQPDRYRQIGTVMMTHDFLRFRLTGALGVERTNISESNLYNFTTKAFDPALADACGIPESIRFLPPIVEATQVSGQVTEAAASQTGLAVGTPVVGGLFDVVASAWAAGIQDEQSLNVVMGTWSVTTGVTQQVLTEAAYPYVYGCHAAPGHYIVHEASPTSAANLEWVRTMLGNPSYETINAEVAALPKAASSVLFAPFLYGSNAGLGLKSGFYGMQALHQRAHLLQAVYEGIVFCHGVHLNRMRARFPAADTLRVTGGPARSAVWMQLLADCTGMMVSVPQVAETGCLGAAMAAAVGTGAFASPWETMQVISHDSAVWHPEKSVYAAYQEKQARYNAWVARLYEFESHLPKM